MSRSRRSGAVEGCRSLVSVGGNGSDLWSVCCGEEWAYLAIALILALVIPKSAGNVQIYLNPESTGAVWDGNCSNTSPCAAQDCLLSASTPVTSEYNTSNCFLIFRAGSFSNAELKIEGDWTETRLSLYFPAGDVSDLVVRDGDHHLVKNYLALVGDSTTTSTLSRVLVNVSSFGGMEFTSISIVNSSLSLLRHTESITTASIRLFYTLLNSSDVLIDSDTIYLREVVSMPNCNLTWTVNCTIQPRCDITIRDSHLFGLQRPIFYSVGPSIAEFYCRDSVISVRAPALTEWRSIDNTPWSWDFSIISTRCDISGLRPTSDMASFLVASHQLDATSSLYLEFDTSTFNNIRINPLLPIRSYIVRNNDFVNCPIDFTFNAPARIDSWNNLTITQQEPDMPVVLRIADGVPPRMTNVTFSNPNHWPGNHFSISALLFADFSHSSLLNISNLHLDTPSIAISSIEVTQGITTSAPGSKIGAYPGDPHTWTFHSIDVSNVILDPSNISTLIYTPSELDTGIKLRGSSRWTKTPGIISVDWPSNLSPKNLALYPLVALPGEHTAGQKIELRQETPSDWIFEGIFFSPPLLSFMALSVAANESKTPCPTVVPDGFQCLPDGTVYATKPVSLPDFNVPRDSGEVKVFGNVTIQSRLVFTGTTSKLAVMGCLIGKEVVWDMSEETDPTEDPVTLITQSASCPSLEQVVLTVIPPPKKGCQRARGERGPGDGPTHLVVALRLGEAGCNTKWIILGAVLGGSFLILMIVVVILLLIPATRSRMPCLQRRIKK